MPRMEDYTVTLEATVTIRSKTTGDIVAQYVTSAEQHADSYNSSSSIPAATTRCVDLMHTKMADVARLTKDHEAKRLA